MDRIYALTAAEIVTLAELKGQMSLEGDEGEKDSVLNLNIEAAVSLVSELTSLPLIDKWIDLALFGRAEIPYSDMPFYVTVPFAQKVFSYSYIPAASEPGVDLTVVNLDNTKVRVQKGVRGPLGIYVKDGFVWPDVHYRVPPILKVGLGCPTDKSLKQAILLAAQAFFENNLGAAKEAVMYQVGHRQYWG